MNISAISSNRMVSKLAVEALRKADDLKDKSVMGQAVLQNIETLGTQQELLKIYHDALIYDLEYALDKKVEQDLWNFGFKNYIVALQNMARDKKDNWALYQARLSWFLDSASGFYLTLLQEICTLFGLDLPFKRHESVYGYRGQPLNENKVVNRPERSSCYYICQHCLVHLGDIARYRNQMVQAESFYRQAVALGANSGHPYNQLALLEASRADRLSTVFYYTRSIAVAHKFPAALTNLANTLSKCTNPINLSEGKMTVTDYEAAFLRLHALLYLSQDVASATSVLQSITHALTPLIATQEFSSWKLVQMSVISIFTYTQVEEKKTEIRRVLSEFLIHFLNALLLPLYTMSGENISDYFSLLAIKILMTWLKCESGLVEALNRPVLWRGLCRLLNILRASQTVAPINYINSALPEDYDLRGFLPLEPALSSLNFGGEELSADVIKKLRSYRIIKLGEWLAKYTDTKAIYIDENGQFDASSVVPISTPIEPQQSTKTHQVTANLAEGLKGRSRHNVALQSIFRRSQCQGNEVNLDTGWQANKGPLDTRWWPQGHPGEGGPIWAVNNIDVSNTNQPISFQEGTYSLFSGSPEIRPAASTNPGLANENTMLSHQSLWSGPGPSPLERLLEQQKQLRHSSQFNT